MSMGYEGRSHTFVEGKIPQMTPIAFQSSLSNTCNRGRHSIHKLNGKERMLNHSEGNRMHHILVLRESNNRKKPSFSRAGGRSRKIKDKSRNKDVPTELWPSVFAPILDAMKKVIPLLLALTIVKALLGSLVGGNNNNVAYYSSTVYERTYYDENGEIQRLRKEKIQSNIPSLITDDNLLEGESKKRPSPNNIGSSFDALEQDLRNLDREIDMFRSTISNDYF